jgi:hypothetical protein
MDRKGAVCFKAILDNKLGSMSNVLTEIGSDRKTIDNMKCPLRLLIRGSAVK